MNDSEFHTPHEPEVARCPYPGLRPFRTDEADRFFGRGQQIGQMLCRLEERRFLAVVGASGCGKSSLVQAGSIPAILEGNLAETGSRWRLIVLRPGDAPFAQLASTAAEALRPDDPRFIPFCEATLRRGPLGLVELLRETGLVRSGEGDQSDSATLLDEALDTTSGPPNSVGHVLLVVDQFEELFRFGQPENVAVSDVEPSGRGGVGRNRQIADRRVASYCRLDESNGLDERPAAHDA